MALVYVSVQPQTGDLPLSVVAVGAWAKANEPNSWILDWGDGSAPATGSSSSYSGNTGNQSHTYSSSGTYQVAFTFTDAPETAYTVRTPVTVLRAPAPSETFTPADPTATSSATDVMMGLGSSVQFTPLGSGKVMLTVDGIWTTPNDNGYLTVAYGTGTPPANGAAATGTDVGATVFYWGGTLFSKAVIMALAVETTYWFDIKLHVATTGPTSLQSLTATVQELQS